MVLAVLPELAAPDGPDFLADDPFMAVGLQGNHPPGGEAHFTDAVVFQLPLGVGKCAVPEKRVKCESCPVTYSVFGFYQNNFQSGLRLYGWKDKKEGD